MRTALITLLVLAAAIGFAGLASGGASAAQLSTNTTDYQRLLASTTPSPTVHASATATAAATTKAASATAAAVPKTGGPPDTSGTSPLAYLLLIFGG